ncbi:peptidoglycan editing factor PgeF [Haliea sp. E1-2-M8]|uniref:peptidoglycan editing factor PgeF n=1 Tax=Haliea sp. E1-2-M8 TaxID=3064706 RepID=UPI00271A75BA|nr:peptidoglycan editing factor PgeF [Haliea sp. E1-2-M8]MDO8862473.1 peptidoglycan editing factor PgeF [Haliea sp. E1-2-M8]
MSAPVLIRPDWPAPPAVNALVSTREGGVSSGPWQGLNLGDHVGDDPRAVQANRAVLQGSLPAGSVVQWLRQVHGTAVVRASSSGAVPEADACWTDEPGIACAVLTADCLPVLLCDRSATVVAAAHAGWRGLRGGVLEATVAALPVDPGELLAWLGPAIGPTAFEVGPEVRDVFVAAAVAAAAHAAAADAGAAHAAVPTTGGDAASGYAAVAEAEILAAFTPAPRPDHYLLDLYALARMRLREAGVGAVHGGGLCTLSDPRRFYSYRRDGTTGRMASLIQLK